MIIGSLLSGFVCLAAAQDSATALIGVTTGNNEYHLFAVSLRIVHKVVASSSNVVSRLFLGKVTHSDCCDPQWKGADCFQCCDSPRHVVCSHNVVIGYLIGRIKGVTLADWTEAQKSPAQFPDWAEINEAITKDPKLIIELDPKSKDAMEFWNAMMEK